MLGHKSSTLRIIIAITVMFLASYGLSAQSGETTVGDIFDDPASYINNRVMVEGTVTQFVRGEGENTDHYLLKGAYGDVIKVNTGAEKPEINTRYKVEGIVYEASSGHTIFISEQSRQPVSTGFKTESSAEAAGGSNTIIYIIIGIAVLIVLVIILVMVLKGESNSKEKHAQPSSAPPQDVTASHAASEVKSREELKTVRISRPPKTVRFIPGKLEVLTGEDKGKTFRLSGYPDGDGQTVTVGRERVAGERAYAHIQISDRYPTVSRKQAEFRYRNNSLSIKNLSETNPTRLDDTELKSEEEREISIDSVISMGELELKYTK